MIALHVDRAVQGVPLGSPLVLVACSRPSWESTGQRNVVDDPAQGPVGSAYWVRQHVLPGEVPELMWVIAASPGLIEAFEEATEDLLSSYLALSGGVVSLGLQGRAELDGGDEEGAGLADRLEVAVELDRSGAVAVAEHATVHLAAEFAHYGSLGVGWERGWLAGVERFDLLGDGVVFVGDGPVGHARIDHRHAQGGVAEQRGDGFQAHAAVDGLVGQGVAELVGGGRGRSRRRWWPVGRPGRRVTVGSGGHGR